MRKNAVPRILAAGLTAGLVLALVAVLPPRSAAAQGAQGGDAGSFIQNLGEQAIQAAGPSIPRPQRIAVFRQLLDSDFDLQSAARFVLGPYARGLNPAQHEEFMRLFRDTVAQAYADKLGKYAGEPFRVTGARPMGDETVVSSEVVRHDGAPVRIDWHVVNRGGSFRVSDVFVDGASQRVAERNEFAGVIERNGGRPDALLAVLRQQLGERPGAVMESSERAGAPPQQPVYAPPPAMSGSSAPPVTPPPAFQPPAYNTAPAYAQPPDGQQ